MKKKEKTKQRSDYVKELDAVFSRFIRLRDSNKKGIVTCPLCSVKIKWNGQNCQNMHFIKRTVLKYKWDEMNCHAGCKRCNVMLHGNYIIYTRWMQLKYGLKKIDEMINDKSVYKISTADIIDKIAYYKSQVEILLKEKEG